MADIVRAIASRMLGLDYQDNVVMGGHVIYFNHKTNADTPFDLVAVLAAIAALGGAGVNVTYASPSGGSNNVAPAGFGTTTNRLTVTMAGGASSWTGLEAGYDGQLVTLLNDDAVNSLTLDALNAGSTAANQFQMPGATTVLPPSTAIQIQYTAGSINKWVCIL